MSKPIKLIKLTLISKVYADGSERVKLLVKLLVKLRFYITRSTSKGNKCIQPYPKISLGVPLRPISIRTRTPNLSQSYYSISSFLRIYHSLRIHTFRSEIQFWLLLLSSSSYGATLFCQPLHTAHKLINIPSSTMNTTLDKSQTSVLDAESGRIVQQALDNLINSSEHTVMIVALQFSKMGPLQK